MTISSTATRKETSGNGVTTAFAYPYRFFADADLVVIVVTDATGFSVDQVLITDYTVAGAGDDAGGTVTMITPPASGETLIIYYDGAVIQSTDYVANDPFPAETHETALDKLTRLIQRTRELVGRSLKLDDDDTSGADTTIPAPEAGTVIGSKDDESGWGNVLIVAPNIAAGNLPFVVSNIAALKLVDGTLHPNVQPLGYYNLFDEAGGPIRSYSSGKAVGYYLAGGTEPENGATIIVPTGGDGSAAFISTEPIQNILEWGAKTGGTDGVSMIQGALDENAGGAIYVPARGGVSFSYTGPLEIPDRTSVYGEGQLASILKNIGTGGENAIEFKGTGVDLSTGSPKSGMVMRDLGILGNTSSGDGLVMDIARNILLDNVFSSEHGTNCINIGAATAGKDKVDLIRMRGVHTFQGTNGIYIGGASGISIDEQTLINGYSGNGLIIEDTSTIQVNANIGTVDGTADNAILIRSSAANNTNARAMVSIHIMESHAEQIPTGKKFVAVEMSGTTKLLSSSVRDSEAFPVGADFCGLSGVVEDFTIDGNYIISSGATAIDIGSLCKRTLIGKNRWQSGVNITDASTADGTRYYDRSGVVYPFYHDNVAAGVPATDMQLNGGSFLRYSLPKPGSVIGLSVNSSAALTAGTIVCEVFKNGSTTGLKVTLDDANQNAEIESLIGTIKFVAGDTLHVRYISSAGLLPSGSLDIQCSVLLNM